VETREGTAGQVPEFQSVTIVRNEAIPIEYRYRTGLAGALVGGVALLLASVVLVRGPVLLLLAGMAVVAVGVGVMGLLADPDGFVRSAGKRLVVDDNVLQEVDERGRVVWSIAPGQVERVRSVPGPRVFPFGGPGAWRAESWDIALDDGRTIRIPVWLLPHRGREFKQRFRVFVDFRARVRGPSA